MHAKAGRLLVQMNQIAAVGSDNLDELQPFLSTGLRQGKEVVGRRCLRVLWHPRRPKVHRLVVERRKVAAIERWEA